MTFTEILLFGTGLSMDAFAVAVCKGLSMKRFDVKKCFLIALFFGGFQALMPFIGYMLGNTFEQYITEFDHWVAFVLLAYIGIKMIREAFEKDDECGCCKEESINIKELFVLAVATSIDALAVGITFSFYPDINIFESITVIGITTFLLSWGGVMAGNKFGSRYKQKAEISGGIILVLLGAKILFEGLGVL